MLFEEEKTIKTMRQAFLLNGNPHPTAKTLYPRIFLPLLITQPSPETKYGVKYTRFRQSQNIVLIVPGDTCILPAQLSVGNRRGI